MCPFTFDLLDEEQKKKEQGQQGDPAAPAMTGGGESFGSGQAQQQGAEKGTNKQGSGFVGLDQYMNANKGNKFGNQFTGKVQGSVDSAKQSLNQGVDAFTQASNQGATKWNDVQGQVKGIVDSAGDSTSQEEKSKIEGFKNAKYQGPDSFLGTAYGTQAQGSVQKATQQAGALQSEGGRFALLDQYFGRPKYSMGEKSLDNLLVQSTPGVAARAQNIGGQAKQLAAGAAQKNQELDNLAASNRQATTDAAAQTRGYINDARSGFESDLNQRYQDHITGNQEFNDRIREDLADGFMDTDEARSIFGLQNSGLLYGVNAGNHLQENPNATLGQFASDQDYARYLALSQLAGEDPTTLLTENRGQAGTGASMGRVTGNQAGLQTAVRDAKGAFDNSVSLLQEEMKMNGGGDAGIDDIQQRISDWERIATSSTDPLQQNHAINAAEALRDIKNRYNQLRRSYFLPDFIGASGLPLGIETRT